MTSHNKINYFIFHLLYWQKSKYLTKLPVGKVVRKQLSYITDGNVICVRFMDSKLAISTKGKKAYTF